MTRVNFRVVRSVFYTLVLLSFVACLDDGGYQESIDAENVEIDKYLEANGFNKIRDSFHGVYMKFFEGMDTVDGGIKPLPEQPVLVKYTQYDLHKKVIQTTDSTLSKDEEIFIEDIVYGSQKIYMGHSITGFALALYNMTEGSKAEVVIPSELAFGNFEPFKFDIELVKIIENDTTYEKEVLADFLDGKDFVQDTAKDYSGVYYREGYEPRAEDTLVFGDTIDIELVGHYAEARVNEQKSVIPGRRFFPLEGFPTDPTYLDEIVYGEPNSLITAAVGRALKYMSVGDVVELACRSDYAYAGYGLTNQIRNVFLVPPYTALHYRITLKAKRPYNTDEE